MSNISLGPKNVVGNGAVTNVVTGANQGTGSTFNNGSNVFFNQNSQSQTGNQGVNANFLPLGSGAPNLQNSSSNYLENNLVNDYENLSPFAKILIVLGIILLIF